MTTRTLRPTTVLVRVLGVCLFCFLFSLSPLARVTGRASPGVPGALSPAALVPDATANEHPARLLPPDLLAYAEAEGLGEFVRTLPRSDLWKRIQSTTAFRDFQRKPEYAQALLGLGVVELASGRHPAEAMAQLLGQRLVAGLALPAEGSTEPALILVAEMAGEEDGAEVLQALENLGNMAGEAQVRSASYRDLPGISLQKRMLLAAVGRHLIFASDEAALRATLDRALDGGASFPGTALHECLQQQRSGNLATLLVDTARIAALQESGRLFSDRLDQPLASLLFGDVAAALNQAPFVAGSIDATDQGLKVRLDVPVPPDALPDAYAFMEHQAAMQTSLPTLFPKHGFATISVRRNWASFWADRADLLDVSTEKGFAEFETGLGVFFAGRSIPDEILPGLEDEVILVGSRQTWPGLDTPPKVRFPAGAMVLRPAEPERFSQELAIAFHSLLGVINLQRGQEGQTPMLLFSEPYRDTTIYGGRFLANDDRPYDVGRYNFSPAMAQVGPWVILSTTEELLRDLVEPLENGRAATASLPAGLTSYLRLESAAIAELLSENREAFVAQNVLNKGHTRSEAEREIDALLELPPHLQSLELRSRVSAAGLALEAELRLNPRSEVVARESATGAQRSEKDG